MIVFHAVVPIDNKDLLAKRFVGKSGNETHTQALGVSSLGLNDGFHRKILNKYSSPPN